MENGNSNPEPAGPLAVSSPDRRERLASDNRARFQSFQSVVNENRDDPDGTGLLIYWRVLNKRRGTLIFFVVAGTLLGFVAGLPKTPMYQARAAIEVLTINEDFLNMKHSSPVTTIDYSAETSELQTEIRLIKSESLIDRVATRLDAMASPVKKTYKTPNSAWRAFMHLREPAPVPRNQLVKEAAASLKVNASGRTRIIELTADSRDPQFAADFANTLANEFIQNNLQSRWENNQKTGEWLSRELDQARSKLEKSETTLQTYAKDSGLVFTNGELNISSEKLQQIQQELSAATADRIAKQSRYELAQSSPPNSLPDVLNDAGLRSVESRVEDLQRQIANLDSTFTPEYSKVKRARAELATVKASFEADRANILERIKNEFQEARRKEKLLAGAFDVQTREVTGQGTKSIQYSILKRDVDSNRQIYDTMLQQLKQSSIALALRASNLRVVDPAKPPNNPFSPNFKMNSILGMLSGIILGTALIVTKELGNQTLQAPGDAQLWVALPDLGTIPSAGVDHDRRLDAKPVRNRNIIGRLANPSTFFSTENSGAEISDLLPRKERKRIVAEAFRSVLASILFASDTDRAPKTLVISSANPGEGKTSVATNLAIAIAEIRRSVLLIDADLRRPRIHQLFRLSNERGLSTILSETPASNEAFAGIVQETSIPGLHVLPSGPFKNNPANLLYSPELPKLLEKLKSRYEMILIDTPPMLQMPDSRILGRAADGVILVVRAQQTTRDAMIAAHQRFRDDRITVLGTVLNDWNPKTALKGYYGYRSGTYEKAYQKYSVKSSL